jgi:hypothetical protein
MSAVPDWYDESKLRKVRYAEGYYGWVVDLGDGTCRYANDPLLGADFGETEVDGRLLTREECAEINRNRPRYGDRVPLGSNGPDASRIIERWGK